MRPRNTVTRCCRPPKAVPLNKVQLCLGGRVVELAVDGGFGVKGDGARTELVRALSERVEAVVDRIGVARCGGLVGVRGGDGNFERTVIFSTAFCYTPC